MIRSSPVCESIYRSCPDCCIFQLCSRVLLLGNDTGASAHTALCCNLIYQVKYQRIFWVVVTKSGICYYVQTFSLDLMHLLNYHQISWVALLLLTPILSGIMRVAHCSELYLFSSSRHIFDLLLVRVLLRQNIQSETPQYVWYGKSQDRYIYGLV